MKRINVIGTTGSGKSTVARQLAEKLCCPWVQMDALFWQPGWTESDDETFMAAIRDALAGECWVLDGNYSRTQALKWARVDTIVWLDYSYTRTLLQLLGRTISRAITRRELWTGTGNRESFYKSFFTRDSIVLWFFKAWPTIRRRYSQLQGSDEIKHVNFIRLTCPRETRRFLASVEPESASADPPALHRRTL